MAEKAFTRVTDTEAQAQAIIKAAREKAAVIIKCAEEETESSFSEFSKANGRLAEEKKLQAEKNARSNSLNFSKETADLCDTLKQSLSLRKAKAVDAVIQAAAAAQTHGGGQ